MKKGLLSILTVMCVVALLIGCGAHKHTWIDATCTTPKTCSECGETEGAPWGHMVAQWETVTEATCKEPGLQRGVCANCGETVEREINLVPHTPGEWEVTREATLDLPGEQVQKCTVCGEVLDTRSLQLSAEEKEAAYKAACSAISYEELARNPDSHKGERVYFYGQVVQVMEGNGFNHYRINVTNDGWGWYDDTVYVEYESSFSNGRILEDDMVTFYGESYGLYTYETVMGAKMTIPAVIAEYIDLG